MDALTDRASSKRDIIIKPIYRFKLIYFRQRTRRMAIHRRNASGLVKSMRPHQVLLYDIMTPSFYSMIWFLLFLMGPGVFIGGSITIGTLLLIPASIPFFLTYALLSERMPMSGGDYYFQSRLLTPFIGFVTTITGWVIWQLFFIAWFGFYISDVLLTPMFYYFYQLTGFPLWNSLYQLASSPYGVFIFSTALFLVALLVLLKGVSYYSKVQYYLFGLSVLSVIAGLFILIHSPSAQTAIAVPIGPPPKFNLFSSVSTWSISWGAIGYSMWSVLHNEEIQSSNKPRIQLGIMLGGAASVIAVALLFWNALVREFGAAALKSISSMWLSGVMNGVLAQKVGAPYFTVLMISLKPNPIIFAIFVIGAAVAMYQVVFAILLGSSRTVLSQSLDSILPMKLAYVSDRSHSPVYSILFSFIVAEIWLALIEFTPWIGHYFVSVIFAVQVTWIATMVAGLVLGIKTRRKLLIMSAAAGAGLNIFIAALFIMYPALGFLSLTSELVVFLLFAVTGIYYLLRDRYLKKRDGIGLGIRFKEIPEEA